MKKIISFCFEKWWIVPLFFLLLISLSLLNDSTLLSFISYIILSIFLFHKLGWKISCLIGTIILVIIIIVSVFFVSSFKSNDEDIHKRYSELYENKTEIQRIIGVEIPEIKNKDSKLILYNDFNGEFEIQTTIEFLTFPDKKFYVMLDEICNLHIPKELDENSAFFNSSFSSISHCWSKEGDKYKYERDNDFGGKFLHSQLAYFSFEITKGSNVAILKYGTR
jgi:energy-coupling factor transporter transmembrane protein EcfT